MNSNDFSSRTFEDHLFFPYHHSHLILNSTFSQATKQLISEQKIQLGTIDKIFSPFICLTVIDWMFTTPGLMLMKGMDHTWHSFSLEAFKPREDGKESNDLTNNGAVATLRFL